MNKIYLILALCLSTAYSFAQDFTISPSNSVSKTIQVGEYATSDIYFTNITGSDLTLGWELIESIVPGGWDFSFCDYTNCYSGTTINGTMTPFSSPNNGFIKVNISSTNTSSAYFKFAVFNIVANNQIDTVEFWFNSVLGINEVKTEKLSVFPNPSLYGNDWSLNNVPLNSSIEVFNSLGQIVAMIPSSNSSTITIDSKLNRGVYFIQVKHDGITENKKLIIK